MAYRKPLEGGLYYNPSNLLDGFDLTEAQSRYLLGACIDDALSRLRAELMEQAERYGWLRPSPTEDQR